MNIQIFGKNKCFDTKKAERYFKERDIKYQLINLREKGMSKGELTSVIKALGGYGALLDLNCKDQETEEEKLEKLLENPQVFKTPIVRNGRKASVGYQPEVWKEWD